MANSITRQIVESLDEDDYREVIGWLCPTCGSECDQPCVTPSGKETIFHQARLMKSQYVHVYGAVFDAMNTRREPKIQAAREAFYASLNN